MSEERWTLSVAVKSIFEVRKYLTRVDFPCACFLFSVVLQVLRREFCVLF